MSEINKKDHKNDSVNIDVSDIIRDLIRDCWFIIIFGLSVAMCTYIVINVLHKPSYKASATFVVTTKGSNEVYTNLAAANMVAETLTKVFSSTVIESKVSEDIGLDSIPGTIDAQLITETNLFVLNVRSLNPHMAYKIITSVMNNYTNVTGNIFGNAILDVLEAPEVPVYPVNNINNLDIMIKAFLIGIAVMTGILAALSITRDNIKNEDEVIQKLNTKLLGVVYHEKKNKTIFYKHANKKKSLLITSASVSFSFVECIKKIRAKYEYKASQSNSNVLLVTSVLENEGKSTIAVNLALALVKKGYNILLVDADFLKPSVYKILCKNIQHNQEISECILSNRDLKDSLVYDENSGLYLLIGSKLSINSIDLVSKEAFKKLITDSKTIMDYVIIDAPPVTVSAHTEILADIADTSILVIKQSTAPTKRISDAINLLSESNSEFLGCIYNNVYSSVLGKNSSYKSYSYKYYYAKNHQ